MICPKCKNLMTLQWSEEKDGVVIELWLCSNCLKTKVKRKSK